MVNCDVFLHFMSCSREKTSVFQGLEGVFLNGLSQYPRPKFLTVFINADLCQKE